MSDTFPFPSQPPPTLLPLGKPARVPEDDEDIPTDGAEMMGDEPTGYDSIVKPDGIVIPPRNKREEEGSQEKEDISRRRGQPPRTRKLLVTSSLTTKEEGLDQQVSRFDWEAVFKCYAETGVPNDIAKKTKLPLQKVVHLINHGCVRLSLPSVKDFAIKRSSVAKRTLAQLEDGLSHDIEDHVGEIQEAATQRAGMEAAAAISLMNTTLRAAQVVQGFLDSVIDKVEHEGQDAFEIPDKITGSWLRNMVKTAGDLAQAVDLASQINRRVSGQPERNLALEIANVVTILPPEALQAYIRSGELPRELRLLKAGQLAGALDRGNGSVKPIIEASCLSTSVSITPSPSTPLPANAIEASFNTAADPLAGTYPEDAARRGDATEAPTREELILEEAGTRKSDTGGGSHG